MYVQQLVVDPGQDRSEDLQKGPFWGLRGSNLGSGTPDLGSGPRIGRVELQNPDPVNASNASNGPILKLNPITRAREGI